MAGWSQLPTDLLQQISEKLKNNEIYLLRFRSVCSTWRSSVPNNRHNHFPLKLPKPSNPRRNAPAGYLIRHSIFLIKPPKTDNQQLNLRPWLIRIGPNLNGKTHLWKPIYFQDGLPFNLPLVLDFNRFGFPVVDFGHSFDLIEGDTLQEPFKVAFLKKVVAATYDNFGEQYIDIVVYENLGEPKMFRFGGNSWTSIFNWPEDFYGDICVFKGRPCVFYRTGLTLMIRPDLSVHLLAEPFSHIHGLQTLVESEGELLLVDQYSRSGCWGDIKMDVFRLDEKEKKWVKLTNLGDKVLLLGDGCSFSASALDLGFSNGNCVIFNCEVVLEEYSIDSELKIYHLDQDRASPLSDYPDYFKLFGPPPEWIVELHS